MCMYSVFVLSSYNSPKSYSYVWILHHQNHSCHRQMQNSWLSNIPKLSKAFIHAVLNHKYCSWEPLSEFAWDFNRYLRELRQRVSVFECRSGESFSAPWQMDHTRAVKDYSRSAADQAEPLPWELRPPEVLQRTMNYLLSAIADRPEIDATGNLWKPWWVSCLWCGLLSSSLVPSWITSSLLSNWCRYEFLWTRTRAIRKDITQQRLCSPAIVSIVEKITRFHIFCAARLVDQSMDAFDPRINSENLTQCLQTLKELYGDLQGAGADLCPCEPEFRAYMILMKLNDCSVLEWVPFHLFHIYSTIYLFKQCPNLVKS